MGVGKLEGKKTSKRGQKKGMAIPANMGQIPIEAGATTLRKDLDSFACRLSKCKCLRSGSIVFRFLASEVREFCFLCERNKVAVVEDRPMEVPVIEVRAEAKRILPILRGSKDARKQFLAGGIRVVGDLRYLSDLAMELGILKVPL